MNASWKWETSEIGHVNSFFMLSVLGARPSYLFVRPLCVLRGLQMLLQ